MVSHVESHRAQKSESVPGFEGCHHEETFRSTRDLLFAEGGMDAAYAGSVARARKLIGRRDPDDVDILALALHLKIPLWSNDDFQEADVERYTTAQLLQTRGISR